MRFLFALLLAIALTANAYASAAAQTRMCCASEECDVMQCLEMGCLPAVTPLATQAKVAFVPEAAKKDAPVEAASYLPSQYKEIWTPPD
jgi:hypothetical protein